MTVAPSIAPFVRVDKTDYLNAQDVMRVSGYAKNDGTLMTCLWLRGDLDGLHGVHVEGPPEHWLVVLREAQS